MCGIVGFYQSERSADSFSITVSQMLGMLRHRGPDELGYFFDEQGALGTARLRILDLQSGQQPLSDASGRYWIAYNGEVYNYLELRHELEQQGCQFYTQSDTEVVLAACIAWGEAALPRFNGGFAFALYDRCAQSLLLARDRYGKRPLFYTHSGTEWVFASEIKCFLAHPDIQLRFDPEQVASILAVWTPLPHQSGYQNISQVPAGAALRLHKQPGQPFASPHLFHYDRLEIQGNPDRLASRPATLAEAAEQTRALLGKSVQLQLRSDVEVGAYLSGGLDSSITTLLAVQHSPYPVRTFSIGFTDAYYDESNEQLLVSRQLGTRHTALQISYRAIAEAFPQALWHAEVPVFRTAFVPMYLLAQRVKAEGIKVVLTGEGADEVFLGYDIFKETLLRQQWPQLTAPEEKQRRLAQLYPYLAHFQQNTTALAGVFDQFAQERNAGLFSHEIRFHNSRLGLRLLQGEFGNGLTWLQQLLSSHAAELAGQTPLQRAQWLEFKTLLAGYLLSSQGDRMSFAHGVETRMPFLDPNLVQWAWTLPTAWKLSPTGDEKYLLKQAFADLLPAQILQRPKQPYRAPDAAVFLAADPPDYLELLLSPHELQKLDLLDNRFAQQFVAKIRRTAPEQISQRENQTFLFLLSLALLHHQMIARQGVRPNTMHVWPPASIEAQFVRRIDGRQQMPKALSS